MPHGWMILYLRGRMILDVYKRQLFKRLDPSRLTTFATCVDQTNYLGDVYKRQQWNEAGTEYDGQLERQQTGKRTHQGGRLFFVA